MRDIGKKWREFVAVVDASADAQLAIAAAAVLPTFILVVGTLLTSGDDAAWPFAASTAVALGKIHALIVGLAAVFYWLLGSLAAAIYRRDRRRLRGE